MRRSLRLVALAVAALVLAACTSIPTSGPVVNGQAVDTDPRDGTLQVVPDGPTPGEDPEEVVRGFIGAAVGFSDDHSVARSFLHPDRRLAWNPDRAVAVYPQKSLRLSGMPASLARSAVTATPAAGPTAAPPSTVTVTVTTPLIARVDEAGRYQVVVPGKDDTLRQRFRLVRSDGEWRIDQLDDGLLMADDTFSRTFRAFPIYFSDPTGRFLVPDLHWLPGTPDDGATRALPTVLVRSLLAGPADYLKGAVTSGAPAGTRMASAAVLVSEQVATVDLSSQVRSVPPTQRRLLLTQLRETLGRLRSISAVDLTVERSPVDVDAGRAAVDPEPDPLVSADPVVVDGRGRIARLDGRFVRLVKEMKGLAVPGANRPALSPDGSGYAVLDGNRAHVVYQAIGGKPTRVVTGSRLTAPSFDPSGWIWASSAWTPGGTVAAGRPGQDPVKVKAPWLARSRVISLRISRDGARALLAVAIAGQAHVFVSGVVRDPDGRPTALTRPLGLVPDLQTVDDAAWVDEDEVVVLGRRLRGRADQLTVAQIGGTLRTIGPVPAGARSVTAGNDEGDIIVGTPAGSSVRIGATAWDDVAQGYWPAFAG